MQLLKILTFLILCDTYFEILCLLGKALIIQLNICTAKAIVFDAVTFFLENCLLTSVMENCSTVLPILPEMGNDYFSCLILHVTSKTFTISSLEEAKCTFRRPLLIVLLSFHTLNVYMPWKNSKH